MRKPKNKQIRKAPVAEVLEPRVLFSADSLSVLGAALLPDNNTADPLSNQLTTSLELANAINDSDNDEQIESDNLLTDNVETTANIELVFVDERTPELQTVVDDITANKGNNVKVIVLSHTESGINVITQTLSQYESVDAIHIVSHSFGDGVRLGADLLNSDTVTAYEPTLASWADSLSLNADLLIYGCELASTDNGLALMSELSLLTGADVAASVDHTGHSSNGGDWLLEKSTGVIETATLVSDALQTQWNHILATWDSATNTITIDYDLDQFIGSVGDVRYESLEELHNDAVATGTEVSLREAIVAANTSGLASNILLTGSDYYLSIGDVDPNIDENNAITGDLDIAGDITIIGMGKGQTTITAQAVENTKELRVLDYRSGVSTLTGVTITGGIIDGDGGGIRATGAQLFMNDIEITGNETLETGIGGGISVSAIYSEARDVDVIDNDSAESGGGIAVTNATMNFFDSTVSANEAPNAAGILANYQSNVSLNASIVENNIASESGAGVGAHGGAVNLFNNSKIQNNTATDSGGGIQLRDQQDPLLNNHIGSAFIQDSEISNNRAINGHGGGINVVGGTTAILESSTLRENSSGNGNGGGINSSSGSVRMEDSIIENNTANQGYGGGLHGTFNELWINDSTFTLNTALGGGGLNITSAFNANIHSSTFFDNTATTFGGAIYVSDDLLNIRNSTIASNTAQELYGAIGTFGSSASVEIFNTIVADNISSNNFGFGAAQVQQLASGVSGANQGFNLITNGAANETNYVRHSSDIIKQNMPAGYVVTADLATDLDSFADSHSEHLALNGASDAIDSGRRTADTDVDAYGIKSNEFVDIGAVEYLTPDPANKIFWINSVDGTAANPSSDTIYRMNENGTGLQQIVEVADDTLADRALLDVAYDPKTQQLFFIREVDSLLGTEYDVIYATADGDFDESHVLKTGGILSAQSIQPGASYKTLALAIEETPDGTPNNLYLAQQIVNSQPGEKDFQILSTPVIAGWNAVTDSPEVWAPILTSVSSSTVDINLPYASYEVGQITALHVVLSSTGDQYISWVDSASNTTNIYPFVVALNGDADRQFVIVDAINTSIRLNNDLARDISYDPDTNIITLVLPGGTSQSLLSASAGTSNILVPNAPLLNKYAASHHDANTNQFYWAQANDDIAISSDNLVSGFGSTTFAVADNPTAITIAPLAPVNTPPRTPIPPEVALAPTFILNVGEDAVGAPIDNTIMFALDEGPDGNTPADKIFYTVVGQPESGKLNFNGAPIYNGAQFTQQDIDNGQLTYTQDVPDSAQDSITFVISDGVLNGPTISRTLEINISNAPEITVLSPNLTIPELTPGGAHIFGLIQVADIEYNSGHTISILDIDGNPHPDISVDASNNLVANTAFDYESLSTPFSAVDPTFDFYIQVENPAGTLSAIVQQTVTVTNVNEPPTITGQSSFSIEENTFGALEGNGFTYDATSIVVEDLDSTSLLYSILQDSVPGANVNFFVDGDGLIKLRLGSEINFEDLTATENPIELTLSVSDQETPALLAQHDITVTVQDSEEAPSISGVSYVEVDENISGLTAGLVDQAGQVDTPMQALTVEDEKYDADPINNSYTLSVHDGTDASQPVSNRFGISQAGQLYVKQVGGLDHENGPVSFILTVKVTDSEGLTDNHQITVGLRDIYEPPTIAGPLNFSIDENSDDLVLNAGGTATMDPLIIGNPENESLTYTLFEVDDTDPLNDVLTPSTRFSFDNLTGLISLAAGSEINFETDNDPVKLRLNASGYPGSASHDITIHINDKPEAPFITGVTAKAEINENLAGATAGVLIDSDTTVIMDGFVISDEQFDPAFPLINPYTVVVNEVNGATETPSTRFDINSDGQLYVSQLNGLDYESDPYNYLLRITVTDAEGEVTSHDVEVELKPVNEKPDLSGNTVGYIDEKNTGVLTDNTGLLNMSAIDIADPELDDVNQTDAIHLDVYEVNSPLILANERFWMGNDGLIRLRAGEEINFEQESGPIELRILATDLDGNADIHQFFVHINDQSEPATIAGATTTNIDENLFGATAGVLIDTATGAPMDGFIIEDEQFDPAFPLINPYSVVVNDVNGGIATPSTLFAINNNGQLYVNNTVGLDFETTNQYDLRIIVTDAENNATKHDVTLHVNPINEAPTIAGPINFALYENATGVLQNVGLTADMQALVIDNPETETLNYEVLEVDEAGIKALSSRFTFDTATNQFSLAANEGINYEHENGPIKLILRVSDTGTNETDHVIKVHIHDLSEAATIAGVTATNIDENLFSDTTGVLIDNATGAPMDGFIIEDEQFNPAQPTINPYSVVVNDVNGGVATPSTLFAINANGQLYVNNTVGLDFEVTNQYDLRIIVTDAENNLTEHDVTVQVNPVNEDPTIAGPFNFAINENATGVLQNVGLTADMQAFVINNPESETLSYDVFELDAAGVESLSSRFTFDPASNQVSLAANEAINYEDENGPIKLILRVSDTGANNTAHKFHVHIQDQSEPATIAGATTTNIDENLFGATAGVLIDTATGTPMDGFIIEDEQFDPAFPLINPYSVVVNDVNGGIVTPSTLFAINNNGQLYVNNTIGLDFETTNQYDLRIAVTDAENNLTEHDVTVQVNPVNEDPTIAGPNNFAINENTTGVLQNVGLTANMQAFVIDNPETEALSYDVFEEDAAGVESLSSRFTFDTATNQVSLAANEAINYEQENGPIKLILRVSDTGNNVTDHAFNVHIHDQSEPATIAGATATNIDENLFGATAGVLIDTATGAPMDGFIIEDEQFDPAQPTINPYSVVVNDVNGGIATPSTLFAINNNGQLYVNNTVGLDFETANQYDLRIAVTDAENNLTEHDVTVQVNPVNEAPILSGVDEVHVSENVSGPIDGILIDSNTNLSMSGFSVDDEEHNLDPIANPLSFSVQENGTTSTRFGIDASGVVYVTQPNGLNYEGNTDPIDLTISVTDSNGAVDSQDLKVTVTNVNELHSFSVAQNLVINENTTDILIDSSTNQTMLPIAANDPDGNTLTYAIEDTGPLSSLFSLTADNRIQLDTALNHESLIAVNTNGIINLQVSVTDNEPGGQTVTQSVDVTVLDTNDAPSHNVALTDLTAIEEELFEFIVPSDTFTDEDGDATTVLVSLANGDPVPAWLNAEYNLQNELVLSGIPADADSGVTHNLVAWAVDSSNESSPTMPFQLVVESKNQLPDDIELSTFSGQMVIPENNTGFQIGSLTTLDNDLADTDHVYSIIGALNQSRFEITSDGILKLRDGAALDFESEQLISIDIQADDQAGGQLIKTFDFNVLDVNEAPTAVVPTTAAVNENESGVVVASIELSDAETANEDLTVTLTNPDGSTTSQFSLTDENDIVLNAPIDHEQTDEVELAVNVSDGENTETYPVTIDVLNVNEAPELEVLPESVDSTPSIPPLEGFSLDSITVSDPDDGDNPQLTIVESGSNALPEWLEINSEENTLEISGTPNTLGPVVELDFIVDDGNGGITVETVTFSLPPAEAIPEPAPEPAPQIVTETAVEPEPEPVPVVEPEPTPIVQAAQPEEPEEVVVAIDNEIDSGLIGTEIDLASLIKPLDKIALVDLSSSESTIDVIHRDINFLQLDATDFSNDWSDLSAAFNQPSDIEFEDLASEFDRQREEMAEQIASTQTLIGSSFTISSGLSVGYLLWLIRGGTLMGSVLSSLPAWRLVDPLPVLSSLGDNFGEDDESLETMVQNDDPESHENEQDSTEKANK